MARPLTEIEAEALALSSADRAQLAARLIASLDGDVDDDPADVQVAWEEELRRRLAELDAGTAEVTSSDEVISGLRIRAHT